MNTDIAPAASKIYAPGYYPDMPDDEYFAANAVSNSMLKRFHEAPAKTFIGKETTTAMQLGTLTHCVILEPEEVEKRFIVTDLERRGTKAWEAEEQAAQGKEMVKRDDWNAAMAMRDALAVNPDVQAVMKPGAYNVEEAMFWEMPVTLADGREVLVRCRAKMDFRRTDIPVAGDVKTTTNAGNFKLKRTMGEMKYPWQNAFYDMGNAALGNPLDHFVFVVIETEAPHLSRVVELAQEQLVEAHKNMRTLLTAYAECLVANRWPGYAPGIQTLWLPEYAYSLAD